MHIETLLFYFDKMDNFDEEGDEKQEICFVWPRVWTEGWSAEDPYK